MARQGRSDLEPTDAPDVVRIVVPVLSICAAVAAMVTDPGSIRAASVLAVAAAALVVWSWHPYPRELLIVLVVLPTAVSQLGGELEAGMFLLALAAVAVTTCHDFDRRAALLITVLLAAPVAIQSAQGANRVEASIWILGVALAATLGWSVRRQAELSARLARAEHDLAEQTVLAERRRIAREVHDVVGHAMTAMMLHVTGARHQLQHDDAAAAASLADAEAVGRSGISELRSALGRLSEDDDPLRAVAPDVSDLPDLVIASRRRGLDVALVCSGADDSIDPMLGLTLYRVTQEALTNAARHAPHAHTDVELAVGDESVRLCITSIGPVRTIHGTDHGLRLGLEGMRERARIIGADFDAGPITGGWWVQLQAPRRTGRDLRGDS